MNRAEQAAQYFLDGYNCAQSVTMAFSDITGMDKTAAAKLAAGFGGGFGRLREVCGAVSGMVMVANQLYGYDAPNPEAQKQCYTMVQQLVQEFQAQTGSMICREILKNPPSDPAPTPRTAEFYQQRPCARMVMVATQVLEDYIQKNPVA